MKLNLIFAALLILASIAAFGVFARDVSAGKQDRGPWKPWSAEGRTQHV